MSRWALAAFLVEAALLGAGARWGAGEVPLNTDVHLVLSLVAFCPFLVGVWLLYRLEAPPRWLGVALVLLALGVRLVTLAGPHRYNSDEWRYAWDGYLVTMGVNPYAHAPDDPALENLRTSPYYAGLSPRFNDLRTVYGPTAALTFALGVRLGGVEAIRALMVLADVAVMVLLALLLHHDGRPRVLAAVYGLNPLVLDAFASRGHVDALMLAFLTLAVLMVWRKNALWAGLALALAVMVKIVALLALPFLASRASRAFLPAFLAGTAVLVWPWRKAGFEAFSGMSALLARWQTNECLNQPLRWLFHDAANVVAALLLLIVVAGLLVREPELPRQLAWAFLALLLLSPAVFPWYVTWCLPFAVFLEGRGRLAALVWSGTVFLWYLRFLVYPPLVKPVLVGLADLAQASAAWMREPWRVLEYLPVLWLIAAPGKARGTNSPRPPC